MGKLLSIIILALIILSLCGSYVAANTDIEVTATPDYVEIPTVTSSAATNITSVSANVHGTITATGYENPNTIGFEWGLSAGNYSANWTEVGSFGLGPFNHLITELPTETMIFWRAFAINSAGVGYSSERFFTTILEYPGPPLNFTATQVGVNTVELSWLLGFLAERTLIRGSTETSPSSTSDGYLVYNGTGTSYNVSGLNIGGISTYYFSAWSENSLGYSLTYATAQIGGEVMYLIVFALICLSLTAFGFSFKNTALMIGAALAWIGTGIYGFNSPSLVSQGLHHLILSIGLALALVCIITPIMWATEKRRLYREEVKKNFKSEYDTYMEDLNKKVDRAKKSRLKKKLFG